MSYQLDDAEQVKNTSIDDRVVNDQDDDNFADPSREQFLFCNLLYFTLHKIHYTNLMYDNYTTFFFNLIIQ